ncbi:hypothetical protein Scep_015180 [Stephania cephalantha]|uniref:Uncharacterized protein n=1 Tax=Stephania cephalantha TaxID=152367 RepID=A0AAP0J2Q1_9MAGN
MVSSGGSGVGVQRRQRRVWCPVAAAADLVWVCSGGSGGSDLVCNNGSVGADVQRRSRCVGDDEQRLQGGSGRRGWSEVAVQRWTDPARAARVRRASKTATQWLTRLRAATGDQQDATSVDSSDFGESPTRTTNSSSGPDLSDGGGGAMRDDDNERKRVGGRARDMRRRNGARCVRWTEMQYRRLPRRRSRRYRKTKRKDPRLGL